MKRANAKNYGREVKGYIIANGMTLTCMVAQLSEKYGWSSCMQNLSGKLRRGTFSYTEAVEIADILGYDIVWKKRKCCQSQRFSDMSGFQRKTRMRTGR